MVLKINKDKFSSGVNLDRFKEDLIQADLTGVVESIDDSVTHLFINGDHALNNTVDIKTIDDVVKAHDGTPDADSALNNLTATTDPTITDDINAGYSVGSKWINTVANKGFLLMDPALGAANWEETTPTIRRSFCFATNSNPYINKNNLTGTYENICMFPGMVTWKVLTKLFIICRGASSGAIDIRAQDVGSGLTIAEMTGLTHTNFQRIDLGTLSNVPLDEAILVIQAKSSAAEDLHLATLCMDY